MHATVEDLGLNSAGLYTKKALEGFYSNIS